MKPKESERAMLIFKGFDENGDDVISKGELFKALEKLGLVGNRGDFEELFMHFDIDDNGYLDFNEFMQFYYMLNNKANQDNFNE